MSKPIVQILQRAKNKHNLSSIRQQITRFRNYNKYHTGLKRLIWGLNDQIDCPSLNYLIKSKNVKKENCLLKYTPDEIKKLKQAKAILEEVFDRQNYNTNTQLLIKQVEDYDRSKQNG